MPAIDKRAAQTKANFEITEPTVSANIKYGPQLEIDNYARLLMFSNHSAPLNIEDGDYDRLYEYTEKAEAMNAIYTFLMKRDLTGFNPYRRPPMTEAKQQIIAESEHPLHTYIIEAVVSGHFRRQLGEEFSFDALQRQLAKEGYGRRRRTYVGSKDCRRREEASVCPAPKRGRDGRRGPEVLRGKVWVAPLSTRSHVGTPVF